MVRLRVDEIYLKINKKRHNNNSCFGDLTTVQSVKKSKGVTCAKDIKVFILRITHKTLFKLTQYNAHIMKNNNMQFITYINLMHNKSPSVTAFYPVDSTHCLKVPMGPTGSYAYKVDKKSVVSVCNWKRINSGL